MRAIIASLVLMTPLALSAMGQTGPAPRAAAPATGKLEWRTSGKALTYGPAAGEQVVLSASCEAGPGYDLTLRLPGAYPGAWEDGQSMEVSVSSGVVPLANLSGAIVESDDETHWLFRTRIGANNPVMAKLFAGSAVQISSGRDGYRIDPREGRAALQRFRESCRAPG